MEIWQTIKNYENYQISNTGKVRNKHGKLLSERLSKLGYNRIVIYGNKPKNKFVHRLVAECFIPNPDNLPQVNHIDGNKLNNSIDNLEWVTRSGNQKHRYEILGKGLCNITLIKDGIIYEFKSIKEASKKLNLCAGALSRLNNNKRKKHKGYEIFRKEGPNCL